MRRRIALVTGSAVLMAAGVLLSAGCNKSSDAATTAQGGASEARPTSAQIDAQKQKIQNDASIPPQAKAAALAAMERAQSGKRSAR